jgi:hypothetical protein
MYKNYQKIQFCTHYSIITSKFVVIFGTILNALPLGNVGYDV